MFVKKNKIKFDTEFLKKLKADKEVPVYLGKSVATKMNGGNFE